jgi:hypothetical protein
MGDKSESYTVEEREEIVLWHASRPHIFSSGVNSSHLGAISAHATLMTFEKISAVPTYLLTPCSIVLLEKLIGSQLVKKFSAFYGTRRFSTAFTSARHLSLS